MLECGFLLWNDTPFSGRKKCYGCSRPCFYLLLLFFLPFLIPSLTPFLCCAIKGNSDGLFLPLFSRNMKCSLSTLAGRKEKTVVLVLVILNSNRKCIRPIYSFSSCFAADVTYLGSRLCAVWFCITRGSTSILPSVPCVST